MTRHKQNAGFTLTELAFVLIIYGMVMVVVMGGFTLYNKQQVEARTAEAFDISEASLLTFQANLGRYPCPAGPGLDRNDANYGREQRDAAGNCVEGNGVVRRPAPGLDQDDDDVEDTVLIGAVPFSTLLDSDNDGAIDDPDSPIRLRDAATYDGYGRKLTYAVSENLTSIATYNDLYGAINVVDENNNPLIIEKEDANNNDTIEAGEDLNNNGRLDKGRYAQYVLVSHGENGLGGYTSAGLQPQACPGGMPLPLPPVVPTAQNEIENCDDDYTFLSGLRYDTDHSHNDDTVKFTNSGSRNLWQYVQGTNDKVSNTNPGSVGIGTDQPDEKLHIAGDLRAIETWAVEYCDNTTVPCLKAETIGGEIDDMQCPAGQVVVSISESKVNCEPALTGVIIPRTCPANCYVSGLGTDGAGNITILCRDKTTLAVCP